MDQTEIIAFLKDISKINNPKFLIDKAWSLDIPVYMLKKMRYMNEIHSFDTLKRNLKGNPNTIVVHKNIPEKVLVPSIIDTNRQTEHHQSINQTANSIDLHSHQENQSSSITDMKNNHQIQKDNPKKNQSIDMKQKSITRHNYR
eukprot:UN05437